MSLHLGDLWFLQLEGATSAHLERALLRLPGAVGLRPVTPVRRWWDGGEHGAVILAESHLCGLLDGPLLLLDLFSCVRLEQRQLEHALAEHVAEGAWRITRVPRGFGRRCSYSSSRWTLSGLDFVLDGDGAEVDAATARLGLSEVERHAFSPQGTTSIARAAGTRVSIHTWPEHCRATVDLLTLAPADDLLARLGWEPVAQNP